MIVLGSSGLVVGMVMAGYLFAEAMIAEIYCHPGGADSVLGTLASVNSNLISCCDL